MLMFEGLREWIAERRRSSAELRVVQYKFYELDKEYCRLTSEMDRAMLADELDAAQQLRDRRDNVERRLDYFSNRLWNHSYRNWGSGGSGY